MVLKKNLEWISPVRGEINSHQISITVNPEVALKINDTPHYIKLYLKSDALTKARSEIMLGVMENALRKKVSSDSKFAVLDVRQSKLLTSLPTSSINLLITAELDFIAAVWDQV